MKVFSKRQMKTFCSHLCSRIAVLQVPMPKSLCKRSSAHVHLLEVKTVNAIKIGATGCWHIYDGLQSMYPIYYGISFKLCSVRTEVNVER
jgi:hypothetical protein